MIFLFSPYETMLIDPNYVDGLRNLQVRFVLKKIFDVLDFFDLELVNYNEKAKDVHMDISCSFCDKFRYWEYNCKNNLASLK